MRKTTLAILGALVCGLLVLGASGLVAMGAAPGSGFAQEEQDAAANASPDVPAQEAAVHPGREDYVQMGCYQCHGYEGHGGGSAGPRIAPDPLAYDAFARIVRRPYGVMPAYSPRVLSDEGLKRIYEYVKSIPASPDASELPLLAGEDEGGSDVGNSSRALFDRLFSPAGNAGAPHPAEAFAQRRRHNGAADRPDRTGAAIR